MNTLATINDIQVSIINYCSIPVVSTEMLSNLYGTGIKNIHDNYRNNIGRFIEGKHFFKIKGEELKAFRLQTDLNGSQISPKTRSLILWTERGAARHAKMLETDQAWEVFEKLEDNYFNQRKVIEQHEHVPSKECNLKLLEMDVANKVVHYHNTLNRKIRELGGTDTDFPVFDRETIIKAYWAHIICNTRLRLVMDFDGTPKLDVIPRESWIVNAENIAEIVGDPSGINREYLPAIIKAAAGRLM